MNYWQPAIVAFRSNYLPAYKAAVIYVPIRPCIYVPIRHYICRESSTNQLLFMQNKPNFRKSQMNLKFCKQMAYEYKQDWTLGQNKPNSNPNKPNLRKAKMNINSLITKDYRKNDDFAVRKNKPNQSQFPCPQTSCSTQRSVVKQKISTFLLNEL